MYVICGSECLFCRDDWLIILEDGSTKSCLQSIHLQSDGLADIKMVLCYDTEDSRFDAIKLTLDCEMTSYIYIIVMGLTHHICISTK